VVQPLFPRCGTYTADHYYCMKNRCSHTTNRTATRATQRTGCERRRRSSASPTRHVVLALDEDIIMTKEGGHLTRVSSHLLRSHISQSQQKVHQFKRRKFQSTVKDIDMHGTPTCLTTLH